MFYSKDQSKLDIVNNVLLPYWESYCKRHWLDGNPNSRFSPETRVKRFLDDVAYLLLRDKSEGTLTIYKDIVRGSTEIDISSCPASIEEEVYGNGAAADNSNDVTAFGILLDKLDERAKTYKNQKPPKPKKRPPTRFEKIERIKRDCPGCKLHTIAIDTENIFEFEGVEYQLSDSVEQYQPRKTREGILFDMDRVVLLRDDLGRLRVFDQAIQPIPDDLIQQV